jgi:hypothetical protein
MKPPPEGSPPLLPSRSIVAATLVTATFAAIVMYFARPATLAIDGQRVDTDVPPVTHARQAFVPVRAVAEGLGAVATFDPKTREISLARGHRTLRMRLGEKSATLNGDRIELGQPPFALRGRAMVVSTAIERAFGPRVRYDSARAKIDVITSGMVEADATKDR